MSARIVGTVAILLALASDAGAAWYTFHRIIPSPTGSPYFGTSMAAVDDRFLVGDVGDSTGGAFAGAVYLIDARTGEFLRTIVHPDPQLYASFGQTVALRGTDIVVGAPQQPVGGLDEVGVVYVFDGASGALRYSITDPAPSAREHFGQALAANGTDIIVGARGKGDPIVPGLPSAPGAAYVYDGATGTLQQSLLGPSSLVLSFGSAVGFVGADPLVGAVNDTSRAVFEGGAYLFDRSTGALRATLHSPTPQAGSAFGSRVGEIAGQPVVAAVFDNLGGPHAGAIYLFDTSGDVVRALPNPAGDQVRPASGYSGQVTLDAIDDRLLAAGFFEYVGGYYGDSDSVYVIDTQTGDVLQTLVAPDPFGTHLAATYVIASNERIVVSSYGELFVFDPVGNGYVDTSEQCDDGNTASGDGCSSHGLLEAPGCPLVPRSDCAGALPGRARLLIRNTADPKRRMLSWRTRSTGGDLGDPTATTAYRLCVYDATGVVRSRRSFTLPAGVQCGRAPCWQARGGGFSYRDPNRVADGIAGATLRRTAGGVAVELRVQGTSAVLPETPLDVPVQVQLSRLDDDECWTSTFSRTGRNGTSGFSARGD